MTPFMHGFAHELVKLGVAIGPPKPAPFGSNQLGSATKFAPPKPLMKSAPSGPPAGRNPIGSGTMGIPAAQRMNYAPGKPPPTRYRPSPSGPTMTSAVSSKPNRTGRRSRGPKPKSFNPGYGYASQQSVTKSKNEDARYNKDRETFRKSTEGERARRSNRSVRVSVPGRESPKMTRGSAQARALSSRIRSAHAAAQPNMTPDPRRSGRGTTYPISTLPPNMTPAPRMTRSSTTSSPTIAPSIRQVPNQNVRY